MKRPKKQTEKEDKAFDELVERKMKNLLRFMRMTVGTREMLVNFIRNIDEILLEADAHMIVAVVCRHDEASTIKTIMCPTPYEEQPPKEKILIEGIRMLCDRLYGSENRLLKEDKGSDRIQ